MEQLLVGIFLYLKSYGIEPINTYDTHPVVIITKVPEIEKITGAVSTGACLNGKIYLSDKYDLTKPIGKCALLHEVVHYIQGHCPIPKDFLDRLYKENQAYQLQNQCLIDNGEKFRAINPLNPEASAAGYIKPYDSRPTNCLYSKCDFSREETADVIRKRMDAIVQRDEKRKKRGFHSRFEDEDEVEPGLSRY